MDVDSDGEVRGRIWLVEDSPLEAEMARRALAPTQEVELFMDGTVLLERAATASLPDVVVLDSQLPGISGHDVCRVLRAQHDAMALPILMLTIEGRKSDIVAALAAGANDYVTKPYDVTELVARIGSLVRTSRLHAMQVRRTRELGVAAEVGAILTRGGPLPEVARGCADVLVSHFGARMIEIWSCRGDELVLRGRSGVSDAELPGDAAHEAVLSKRPFVSDGVVAVPLVLRDEVIGVISASTKGDAHEVAAALPTVADLLALGLARGRAEVERAELLDRERSARADAEAANRSKDEFLAMVSHELRTPLNAITGWTTMLLSGGLDEAQTRRALETIDRSARTQAQLIDDLLDISRIISGRLRLAVGVVNVGAVAQTALESVRLAADAKGVQLEEDIASDAGAITGDADRLQQVVWNLLSNAIKFTPKGGRVTLLVRRRPDALVICVEDSGQGIAAEFLPYVFHRFKQADGSVTRSTGGLGLGLSIVRHIVELHGGTVEARSPGRGAGSTFVVTLPIEAQIGTQSSERRTLAPSATRLERPANVAGLRVLVVDDETDARELLKALLESCRIQVKTVASAEEAFRAVRSGSADVLLSDIAMPGEDGLSLIRRVRALPRDQGGRTPAIALTAYARLDDRTRALRAGFDGHVAKPVEPNELLAVLGSVARAH